MPRVSFAAIAAVAALLVGAGPAAAAIAHNGHGGLGASVTDGTSNTLAVGELSGRPPADAILMADMGGQ